MAIDDGEWTSIARMIGLETEKLIGRRRDYFMIAKVIKSDKINKLIWVKELGDQPIPLVAFNYDITYFDESPRGQSGVGDYRTYKKKGKAKVICPKRGERVLIAREMGSDFLPRCLGVIQSKNYVVDLSDE